MNVGACGASFDKTFTTSLTGEGKQADRAYGPVVWFPAAAAISTGCPKCPAPIVPPE